MMEMMLLQLSLRLSLLTEPELKANTSTDNMPSGEDTSGSDGAESKAAKFWAKVKSKFKGTHLADLVVIRRMGPRLEQPSSGLNPRV